MAVRFGVSIGADRVGRSEGQREVSQGGDGIPALLTHSIRRMPFLGHTIVAKEKLIVGKE